jgi:low temperature requirement protein LtrA
MYGAYAWLTNSRPPVHTAERLLLLVGMAGFLVVGLAIPRGFAGYGVVLGAGYLAVVVVHTILYYRANPNILRVAPFNVGSALLVIAAGFLHGPAGYLLWVLAVAVQLGSPLIVHPRTRFRLRPAHFCERHGALLIVAIGESVAAVGIGAAGPASRAGAAVSWRLLAGAVLGLAVAAALWWIVFGAGDQERAEQVLSEAAAERRTALALNAFFYGNIPLLLGLVATAAAILRAVVLAAGSGGQEGLPARAGQAALLACGAALFLAGDVIFRRTLGIAPWRPRAVAAAAALPTAAVGIAAGLNAQLVLVAAVLVAPLVAERVATPGLAPGETGPEAGAETGGEAGSETGGEAGPEAGAETGPEAGAEAGGAAAAGADAAG